jgi:nicotinate-nucleotide adenylyltransferase
MDRLENNIGILGGSFDPVHIGHLILAEYALAEYKLDKIIFIPNRIPNLKKPAQALPRHRYLMVKLAIQDNPRFMVSDIEIKRKGISYTYDTVRELKKKLKNARFFFIIGSDAYNELPHWKNFKKLIKEIEFIVATRPKSKVKKIPGVKFQILNIPEVDVSSSYIRERVNKGLSIRYLVPDRVWDYIREFNLYR